MAAPSYFGTVTVWGAEGTLLYTGLAAADNLLETLSYEDDAEEHESKDRLGETVGLKIWNPCPKLNVSFYPCKAAGVGAIAGAKANVVLPARGAKVTLAGFPPNTASSDAAADIINRTTWLYVKGGKIEFKNTGEVMITLPVRRYNTDIAATANT
jgi:hypothetical protein